MSDVEYLTFADGEALPIQPEAPSNDSPFTTDPHQVGRQGDGPRIQEKVEDSIDRIRHFGALALERLADMPKRPDKVTVEIAVKVSAEAGVVIAKCATEANFKIAMEWSRKEQADA